MLLLQNRGITNLSNSRLCRLHEIPNNIEQEIP